MTQQANLMGSGMAPLAAQSIVGQPTLAATATGASQNSLALPSDFVVYTTSTANNGPTLPSLGVNLGDVFVIANMTANSINVWPPTGGKISNGSANAAFAVASNKVAEFYYYGGGNYAANLSA